MPMEQKQGFSLFDLQLLSNVTVCIFRLDLITPLYDWNRVLLFKNSIDGRVPEIHAIQQLSVKNRHPGHVKRDWLSTAFSKSINTRHKSPLLHTESISQPFWSSDLLKRYHLRPALHACPTHVFREICEANKQLP